MKENISSAVTARTSDERRKNYREGGQIDVPILLCRLRNACAILCLA